MPYISNRRIYLTADRKRAVEEGDPKGRTLLVGVGGLLPECEARRYGLLPAPAPEAEPEAPAEPEPEPEAPAEPEPEPVKRRPRGKR